MWTVPGAKDRGCPDLALKQPGGRGMEWVPRVEGAGRVDEEVKRNMKNALPLLQGNREEGVTIY